MILISYKFSDKSTIIYDKCHVLKIQSALVNFTRRIKKYAINKLTE